MASNGNQSACFGNPLTSSTQESWPTLQLDVLVAKLLGMGFNSHPPRPITVCAFKFLKSVDLGSVGLGLGDIPAEYGWNLVVWESTPVEGFAGCSGDLGVLLAQFENLCDALELEESTRVKILEACDIFEEKDPKEAFGHQNLSRKTG